jgi:predicted kinase
VLFVFFLDQRSMTPPTIILVTGLPCTGKTTLARRLAARLNLPLFTKDLVKETLFDTLGWSDRDWSKQLGVASTAILFRTIEAELAAGRSCIAESNFHPELDLARLEELRARHTFTVAQVLCVADGPTLLARYRARAANQERHPGHRDDLLVEELVPHLLQGRLAPLTVDGVLIEVDTTDLSAVDDAAIAARLAFAHHSEETS